MLQVPSTKAQPASTIVINLLLTAALATFLLWFTQYSPNRLKGTDFPDFYAAAKIVQAGRGHELYEAKVQDEFLARYAGRVGTYFIHPPVETLLYLPLSSLPLYRAYQVWCAVNVLLLVLIARLLAACVITVWSWRILLPLLLLFPPVLLNLLQGQDAILLLMVFALAFVAIRNEWMFTAGCLLACALFKFHLAFAIAVPLLWSTGKKFLAGFASVGAVMFLASAAISGWKFLLAYPRFLASLHGLPLAGIHDEQMANLRGLFGLLFPGMPRVAAILTVASSLLVLWFTMRGMLVSRSGPHFRDLALANTVIAADLVSYHLSPHDLAILLLPMALVLNQVLGRSALPRTMRFLFSGILAGLLLPPLYLWLLSQHLYTYICIPILVLFGLIYREIWNSATAVVRAKAI